MTPKQIYKLTLTDARTRSISQGEFVRHYNDAANEIIAEYGETYTVNGEFVPIETVEDTSGLKDEYSAAMENEIKFRYSGETIFKELAFNARQSGYVHAWRAYKPFARLKIRSFNS